MQLPDAAYGEAAAFNEIQSGAPMNAPAGAAGAVKPQPMMPPTPLSAPSERPGEPVTAGAAAGPGPGPEALGPTLNPDRADIEFFRDKVPILLDVAERDDIPPSVKIAVRRVLSQM